MENLFTFFLLSVSIAFGIYWGTHTKQVNRNLASLLTIGGLAGIIIFIVLAILFVVIWGITTYPQDAKEIGLLIGGAVIYFAFIHPIITKFVNSRIGSTIVKISGKTIWYFLIGLCILYALIFVIMMIANKINY